MRTLIVLAAACAAFVPRTPALRRRTARDAMLPDVALSIADGSLATSAAVAVGTGAATLGTLLLGRGDELDDFATSPLRLADAPAGGGDARLDAPYVATASSYDPAAAASFYAKRPLRVLERALVLAQLTGGFNLRLLLDWRLGRLEQNEAQRAREALELVEQLGPTFIKLGQALSIRTDLIPEAYALELRKLQDAVPPFDDRAARRILATDLAAQAAAARGAAPPPPPRDDASAERAISAAFASLSPRPIASASIGQVYKGTLKDGREVAVKVQRPSVLSEIALDLFILRAITPLQVRLSNAINKVPPPSPEDIETSLTLVDEWGRGFVAELDYLVEADNGEAFAAAMVKRGLDAVTAPSVVRSLSTNRVLVSEWVEGTRLDLDASPDVPRLCGVAINAYLTMLLDTGAPPPPHGARARALLDPPLSRCGEARS